VDIIEALARAVLARQPADAQPWVPLDELHQRQAGVACSAGNTGAVDCLRSHMKRILFGWSARGAALWQTKKALRRRTLQGQQNTRAKAQSGYNLSVERILCSNACTTLFVCIVAQV